MNNADFGASVRQVIVEGFTPEGLQKQDNYSSCPFLHWTGFRFTTPISPRHN